MAPRNRLPEKKRSAEGKYANYFKVGHNALEFIIDFGQLYSDSDHSDMHTRIVTGPVYAKALLKTLNDAIDNFETTYGSIRHQNDEDTHDRT